MITRAQVQFYRSLAEHKSREETSCFAAEGDKLVREALSLPADSPFRVEILYGLREWCETHQGWIQSRQVQVMEVSPSELERISFMKTPNQVSAVIRRLTPDSAAPSQNGLFIGLDQLQDPGNMGTIVRLADWFGIDGIMASDDSVDFFSPKAVQASMGSIFRVRLMNGDLEDWIRSRQPGMPVYGTRLTGEDIYTTQLSGNGLILLGNESRGLNPALAALATVNLRIPAFTQNDQKPESLNVSVAAAIICSEFRRRGNG